MGTLTQAEKKLIRERILDYKDPKNPSIPKVLSRQERIAALLLRNKTFLEEGRGPKPEDDLLLKKFMDQKNDNILSHIRDGKLIRLSVIRGPWNSRNRKPRRELYLLYNVLEWFYKRPLKNVKKDFLTALDELRGKSLKKIRSWIIAEMESRSPEGFAPGSEAWENFCQRWHINSNWTGEDSTLKNFTHYLPLLISRNPKTNEQKMETSGQEEDPVGEIWDLHLHEEKSFIYLKIFPWTIKKDLQGFWPAIEAKRKNFHGLPWRTRDAFEQALCFWDLHTQPEFGRLSYRKICQSWHGAFPNQEEPQPGKVQKAVERMQHLIDQLTPQD